MEDEKKKIDSKEILEFFKILKDVKQQESYTYEQLLDRLDILYIDYLDYLSESATKCEDGFKKLTILEQLPILRKEYNTIKEDYRNKLSILNQKMDEIAEKIENASDEFVDDSGN